MRRALLPLSVVLLPSAAYAQVLSQVSGFFNIMVGLMLVFAFLFFFGGLGMWFVRLGTWPTYRDEAIRLMQWGVVILFVLAALLAIVQFVQKHVAAATFLAGIVIVIGVAWVVVTVSQAKGEDDEKKH